MTRVLLITDSDRVQRVFQLLEGEGVLQLRAAATLALSDEELAQANPEVIFAQSRISGFSSDLALRSLRKGLPLQTRIVLLPVDDADLAQARKGGKAYLPLALDDAALADGIRRLLVPEPAPGRKPAEKEAAAAKTRGDREKRNSALPARETAAVAEPELPADPRGGGKAPPATGDAKPAKGKARSEKKRKPAEKHARPPSPEVVEGEVPKPEPIAGAPLPFFGTPQWIAEEPPADLPVPDSPKPAGAEMTAEEQASQAEKMEQAENAEKEFDSFAEVMKRAAGWQEEAAIRKASRDATAPSVPPPVEAGEIPVATAAAGPGEPAEAPEPEVIDDAVFPVEETRPAEPEAISSGLVRREKRKPRWFIPLILVILALPVAYLAAAILHTVQGGKKQERRAPAQLPTSKPPTVVQPSVQAAKQASQPRQAPGAAKTAPVKPAPVQPTPVQPAPAKPAPARPAHVVSAPPAQPAMKGGLKVLPPFMAGVPEDTAYARRHPGWQRYLGARGEYKIYREGNLYRALQIIALPGQAIPDEIYQRSLLEFGGVDSYRVQSTERRGSFLVEHGEARGGVGVTVYRKLKDQSLKGLVIFYH